MSTLRSRTFSSLEIPNYRRFALGALLSTVGTWVSSTAQAWLVLDLTGSGSALGLAIALQFLPTLVLGPYAGLLADRLPKQRLLLATTVAGGGVALALGLLVAAGAVTIGLVYALALAAGVVTALDFPARLAFLHEVAGAERLPNAVTLNSVIFNTARAVGPAIAGVLIAVGGSTTSCFLLNATSYAAAAVTLATLDRRELHPSRPAERRPGQLREGLAHVRATRALRVPLTMMVLIGTLTYEFGVTLPLLARYSFEGGPGALGWLSGAVGAGAVVGGLVLAAHPLRGVRAVVASAAVFGALVLAAAAGPTLPVAVVVLLAVGAASVAFLSSASSTLQLAADDAMRGRVMALWSVAFLGSTPLGGPLVGWVGEAAGPRWAIGVGGVAALAAAGYGAAERWRRTPSSVRVTDATVTAAGRA